MKTYIHYGHKSFDRNKFNLPENSSLFMNKPAGGLWASKIDAEFGWKDWCKRENFRECDKRNSFSFKISDSANIMYINCMDDLKQLPYPKGNEMYEDIWGGWIRAIDFERLIDNGVDAIEVNISSDGRLYMALYGWDCDSTVILNPNIIETIQN